MKDKTHKSVPVAPLPLYMGILGTTDPMAPPIAPLSVPPIVLPQLHVLSIA